MKRHLSNVLAAVSLVMAEGICLIWLARFYEMPSSERLDLSLGRHDQIELAIDRTTASVGVWHALTTEQELNAFVARLSSQPRGSPPAEFRVCRFLGFLFEHGDISFWGATGLKSAAHGWAVGVPTIGLIAALAVFPAVRIRHELRRHRRARADQCVHCGYDLRATPDRCPECGTAVKTAAL